MIFKGLRVQNEHSKLITVLAIVHLSSYTELLIQEIIIILNEKCIKFVNMDNITAAGWMKKDFKKRIIIGFTF